MPSFHGNCWYCLEHILSCQWQTTTCNITCTAYYVRKDVSFWFKAWFLSLSMGIFFSVYSNSVALKILIWFFRITVIFIQFYYVMKGMVQREVCSGGMLVCNDVASESEQWDQCHTNTRLLSIMVLLLLLVMSNQKCLPWWYKTR